MKKFFLFAVVFSITAFLATGQVTDTLVQVIDTAGTTSDTLKTWKFTGVGSINFSQTSFSDNWQAGGFTSVAGLGLLNAQALYQKNRSSWENVLEIKYGLNKIKGEDFRKTDDIFDFTSKYGFKASKDWFYSVLLNFKTQLDKGIEYTETDTVVISRFLAPAYIIASLGMDYKPAESFSLLISPVTEKITIVNDETLSDNGAFGVEPGEKVRYEFGASLKNIFIKEIITNVTFSSKLGLFYNYLDDPQIDVDWELMLNLKINKYLSTNVITHLIYDKDQINEVQFKEVFALGFNYKF